MRGERVPAGSLIPGDQLIVPDYSDGRLRVEDVARDGDKVVLMFRGNYKPLRCTATTCFMRVPRGKS